eukprot:269846-Chlamydomonas_euryale.AAC.2
MRGHKYGKSTGRGVSLARCLDFGLDAQKCFPLSMTDAQPERRSISFVTKADGQVAGRRVVA